jgi:hypothetical protein
MLCHANTFAFLAAVLAGTMSEPTQDCGERQREVPARAKTSLAFDKQEHVLGENILLHFVVENAGQEPFTISMGGDYRGAARALRFKVSAIDQDGNEAPDPNPSEHNFGGIGHEPVLKPGDTYVASLQLYRYRRLEKPGTYTIRVTHDLGWRTTDQRKVPVAEAKLKVVMPDAQQTRQVVESMYALPKDHGGSAGQRRAPFADFHALHYPIYLPLLAPRAAEGSQEALAAIGVMASPEATRTLIDLAQHKDAAFALLALRTLNHRLPDPQLEGKLGRRNPFFDDLAAPRQWLIKNSWKPELAPPVRKLADSLLRQEDVQGLQCGGYILQCLGERDDVPALVRGLEIAVALAKTQPPEQGIYPRPRGACMELLRAADVMVQRGLDVPLPSESAGERILFAQAIKQRKSFRPDGWIAAYAALLEDPWPFVRQVALTCLPDAPDAKLRAPLPKLLLDPDVDVQIAACHVAAKVKTPELRKPLLEVVRTAREDWLLRAAHDAASAAAVPRLDILRAIVDRLDEDGMAQRCLQHLTALVKNTSGRSGPPILTPAEATACKAAWLEFVRGREQELARGQTYAADDASVPLAELFPRTTFHPRPSK